jgi:phage-related tail protein
MRDKASFEEKLQTLEKLVELGGDDPIIDQTITKLLNYATERHRKDLEDLAAKLRALEEQFGMTSDLFSEKFQRGELGDDEAFFRWHALVEMQRRVAQRLALLLADSAT